MGLWHHPFWLQLVWVFVGFTFELFRLLCLAKDHWWVMSSLPEMRIWSILLIKSDLKWCTHLSRSLLLYFRYHNTCHNNYISIPSMYISCSSYETYSMQATIIDDMLNHANCNKRGQQIYKRLAERKLYHGISRTRICRIPRTWTCGIPGTRAFRIPWTRFNRPCWTQAWSWTWERPNRLYCGLVGSLEPFEQSWSRQETKNDYLWTSIRWSAMPGSYRIQRR